MMKLQQLLQEKRDDILAVAAKHGAFNVRVFGSVSRGEEKVYVEHILDCIDKINQYTGSDKQRFIGDDLVQDGVLRRLQTKQYAIGRV